MANKKILIVEDDKFLRDVLAQKLSAQGMEIQAATDGANALEILKTFKPELIILDLLLPDIDGFGVLTKIQQDAEMAKVPAFNVFLIATQRLFSRVAKVTWLLTVMFLFAFSPDIVNVCSPV